MPVLCSSPTLPTTDAPRRERRKQARPGELLTAALELFVEKGFAATRVEEVAQRAGVSKGTLFLYFSSKEELFKAVVRENISGHYPEWQVEVDSFRGHSADLLRHAMLAWWTHIGSTRASGISKLIMSEASNFPELAQFYQHEVVGPGKELIRRILQRGVDQGHFRVRDMASSVYTVLAPLLFLALWKHSLGQATVCGDALQAEDFMNTQIDTLLHGLCLPEGAARLTDTTTTGR